MSLISIRKLSVPAICAALALASAASPAAAEILVVVTSKPVHSLVAKVMNGIAQPSLLIEGATSPHTFSMRPSDAQKVNRADVFVRVSDELEPFTERLVKSLPKSVTVMTLSQAPGVALLQRRSGGPFELHQHGQGAKRGGAHKAHAHGSRVGYDAHVWLDPDNAKAMANDVATVLGERWPDKRAQLEANAADLSKRLDNLTKEIAADLAPVAARPFVVLHDAYQYFERRFGLGAIGSIVVSPEEQPSAKRITDLRRKVAALSAVCVFAEPNHQRKVVSSVIEGTSARTAVLDPEGATIEPGPSLYFDLMRRLSQSMRSCLSPS